MTSPVIVAGAGPTGLTLAAELRIAGVPVVLLERDPVPRGESRGMGLHARTVEVLHQRGVGHRFRTPDTPVWPRLHFSLFWLDLSEVGDDAYTLAVPQWRTEQVLEEWVVELGAEIRRGHEVIGLEQTEDEVTVRVRGPEGEYPLAGAYLVGADGGHSSVRKLAGFAFPGTGSTFYGVLGDLAVPPGDTADYRVNLYPGGLYAEVPLEGGTKLRLMTTEFDVEPPPAGTPVTDDELRAAVKRLTGSEREFDTTLWRSRFGNATRIAERYRIGRVFLAGDAAHVHYPIGGQGLNTGVQDAVNLGWKLAAAVHGRAPAGLLDSYHDERHPVGRQVCMNTQAQIALMHPLDSVGPLRELFGELTALPEVNRYLLEMVTGTGFRYTMPYADESAGSAHELLGRRVPDLPLVTDDGEGPDGIAAALHSGRAVLLHLDPATAPPAVEGWGDRVLTVVARPVPGLDATSVLIRPDGHIAHAGHDPRDPLLRTALTTWLGDPDSHDGDDAEGRTV
ncbi:FAD-dependent monooxygenase [Streptomyces qinzhouensis]|uniref:Monooxygenase n=1 Tax=Streptomyces qinzhouensis TaxID=2599401 RepID=A0A5B8JJ53_9ACTN|nr:FAD-dependent monooxygenase [Streptomyces qinzhouensis]QDY80454.1 monooxygenase [Streptomyces qinzhouensis]